MLSNKFVKMPKVNIFTKKNSASILNDWDYVYKKTLVLKINPIYNNKQKALIHTIRHEESEFYLRSAESVLNSWDVVSTSLIDICTSDRAQWADVGLLLAVPPQNIIGTYPRDISFPNNIGNEPNKPRKAMELMTHYFNAPYHVGSAYGHQTFSFLKSPNDKMLQHGCSMNGYNEVVVVGKSNINTYEGRPPTQPITVCAIYVHPKKFNARNEASNEITINKLKAMNPSLPVFEYGKASNYKFVSHYPNAR